jgi:phenylalanyl-tRNA synthetase beta chain
VVTAERLADEPWTLGAVIWGRLGGNSWTGDGLTADFSTAAGVVDALCARLGVRVSRERLSRPYLHPGRAARILLGDDRKPAGELGELHPTVAARFDLEGRVAVLELDLDALTAVIPAGFTYREVPDQPPVRQDIAVVVSDEVEAGAVVAAALESGAPLLEQAHVFDVFRDPARLGEEQRSLAIRLVFQAPDRTLTEDEASAVREQIVAALAERFGARLRG